MGKSKEDRQWISCNVAARILQVDDGYIPQLGMDGLVRWRQLPARRRQYWRADIERIAAESVREAVAVK